MVSTMDTRTFPTGKIHVGGQDPPTSSSFNGSREPTALRGAEAGSANVRQNLLQHRRHSCQPTVLQFQVLLVQLAYHREVQNARLRPAPFSRVQVFAAEKQNALTDCSARASATQGSPAKAVDPWKLVNSLWSSPEQVALAEETGTKPGETPKTLILPLTYRSFENANLAGKSSMLTDTSDTDFHRIRVNWSDRTRQNPKCESACKARKHWLKSLSVGITETC